MGVCGSVTLKREISLGEVTLVILFYLFYFPALLLSLAFATLFVSPAARVVSLFAITVSSPSPSS